MNTATYRQINFLSSLLADTEKGLAAATEQGREDLLALVAEALTADIAATMQAVRSGSQEIDKVSASVAIDLLKTKVNPALAPLTAIPVPVGLAFFNPKRVIVNKYAKACAVCGAKVPATEGHALLTATGWTTVCAVCADRDPAEIQRIREDQARQQQAQMNSAEEGWKYVDRPSAIARDIAVRDETKAYGIDLFDRAGASGSSRPDVHVAVPSATGSNDLDFFRVTTVGLGATAVYRVIGGRGDQRLSNEQARDVLWSLVLTDDIPEAMAAYGREIGRCGYCHRHLTDEESRSVGLGPVCAGRLGR